MLTYGDHHTRIEFDDRTLAHLHVVFSAKLRRHESFFFSWSDTREKGGGRTSIWVDPGVPLYFTFSHSRRHELNTHWLEHLTRSANSAAGLHLLEEVTAPTPSPVDNRLTSSGITSSDRG